MLLCGSPPAKTEDSMQIHSRRTVLAALPRRVWFLFAALLLAISASAQAQSYPDRTVRVLVGYAAGSGPDIQARTVVQQLATDLGQSFIVENRVGANGTIAARSVVQAAPDGYTLLFSSNGIAPTPYIYKNLGYNVFTDLKPIATIGQLDGLFVLVDAKSDFKTGLHCGGQAEAAALRLARNRQRLAFGCGTVQQGSRNQDAAHPVQGRL